MIAGSIRNFPVAIPCTLCCIKLLLPYKLTKGMFLRRNKSVLFGSVLFCSAIVNVKSNAPEKFDYRYYCITMKVFQDHVTQGSWIAQKNMIIDNKFGNLCMKKGGSFQKERFSFFSVVNGGGFDPRTPPPPRAYATGGKGSKSSLLAAKSNNGIVCIHTWAKYHIVLFHNT